MIKIQRPATGPARWTTAGSKQTELDCAAYDACPRDYRFRWRKLRSEKQAKNLLLKVHNHKCAYCEKRLRSDNLHFEHFRPKAGVRQTRDQKRDDLPSYYWLAYCWDNLLLACNACNSTFKRTLFPLANPTRRSRSHHDPVTRERALFVNPLEQDPRRHIRFDHDKPTGKTLQGHTTISGLGLDRPILMEERLKLLDMIRFYVDVVRKTEHSELRAEARELIEAAKRPEAEFSSMVTDYLDQLGL